MAQRGRKSVAQKTTPLAQVSIGQATRVEAPVHMSDAEMSVWTQAVNDMPAGFFTEVHKPMLEMYCRHVVQSVVLSQAILSFNADCLHEEDGQAIDRYDKLLKMHERESRAASSLATRLRITKQAIDQQTVARTLNNSNSGKRKPWLVEQEE